MTDVGGVPEIVGAPLLPEPLEGGGVVDGVPAVIVKAGKRAVERPSVTLI